MKWEQSPGPCTLCVPWEVSGLSSEKGFEVRLIWCFPKGTEPLPAFQFRSRAATQPCPKSPRSGTEAGIHPPLPLGGQPPPQGQAGAICSPTTGPTSQNPSTNHGCPEPSPGEVVSAGNPGGCSQHLRNLNHPFSCSHEGEGQEGPLPQRPHMPDPQGSLAHRYFLSSPPQRAASSWGTTKTFIRRVQGGRAPQDPGEGSRQLLLALGSSLCAPASTRRCRHWFPRGKSVPAGEDRLAVPSPQAGGSTQGDPGLTLGTARGGDCSAPRSSVAFGCRWLLSHLAQPPPGFSPVPQTLPGAA